MLKLELSGAATTTTQKSTRGEGASPAITCVYHPLLPELDSEGLVVMTVSISNMFAWLMLTGRGVTC